MTKRSLVVMALTILVIILIGIRVNGYLDETDERPTPRPTVTPTATSTSVPTATATYIPTSTTTPTDTPEPTITYIVTDLPTRTTEPTPTPEVATSTPVVELVPYVRLKEGFEYEYAYLRAYASTSAQIVGKLYVGEELETVGTVGEWHEVLVGNGHTAWIAGWISEVVEH